MYDKIIINLTIIMCCKLPGFKLGTKSEDLLCISSTTEIEKGRLLLTGGEVCSVDPGRGNITSFCKSGHV